MGFLGTLYDDQWQVEWLKHRFGHIRHSLHSCLRGGFLFLAWPPCIYYGYRTSFEVTAWLMTDNREHFIPIIDRTYETKESDIQEEFAVFAHNAKTKMKAIYIVSANVISRKLSQNGTRFQFSWMREMFFGIFKDSHTVKILVFTIFPKDKKRILYNLIPTINKEVTINSFMTRKKIRIEKNIDQRNAKRPFFQVKLKPMEFDIHKIN